jgi:hypothetical protein
MASVDPLEYDASYYALLASIQHLPEKRHCARQLAWEDYCGDRAREVVLLARHRPDESHLFAFFMLTGKEMYALVSRSSEDGSVDATLHLGERVLCTFSRVHPEDAAETMAAAARGHRARKKSD